MCPWFNALSGFGYLIPDNSDERIFFHQTRIQRPGLRIMALGERLTFQRSTTAQGQIEAINVVPTVPNSIKQYPFPEVVPIDGKVTFVLEENLEARVLQNDALAYPTEVLREISAFRLRDPHSTFRLALSVPENGFLRYIALFNPRDPIPVLRVHGMEARYFEYLKFESEVLVCEYDTAQDKARVTIFSFGVRRQHEGVWVMACRLKRRTVIGFRAVTREQLSVLFEMTCARDCNSRRYIDLLLDNPWK